ncbi:unnamed protein product, partial [Schistosoma curassoni]|uniref:DUF4314 domain-containing protein n=1 Tax=Schistosoma curassoni TaxID=6186 RepID=A0A183JSH2_9TREM
MVLERDEVEKPKALSEYSSKAFSINDEERPTIRCDWGGLSMDPLVIKEGTVLRLRLVILLLSR